MAAVVSKPLEYDAETIQQLVETVYGLHSADNFNWAPVWLYSITHEFYIHVFIQCLLYNCMQQ